MTREPGFYGDVPEDEYHADRDSLSVSGAKLILKAPALFKWQQDHPVHKDVFDVGTAAHRLVLGVGATLAVGAYSDFRSKEARLWRDKVREDGQVPILAADHERVKAMADALSGHKGAMLLLDGGEAEVSAYARDEWADVLLRGRFDYLRDDLGVDYKTCADVSPGGFAAACARYGYDQQAAWYTDLAALLGHVLEDFAFIAQAKEPPYLVEVYNLDADFVSRGRARNRVAIDRYAACIKTGTWPGFTGRPYTTLSAPKWARYNDDLQEMTA